MAKLPCIHSEGGVKSATFSVSFSGGAGVIYAGTDRVVVGVKTDDIPYVLGIEQTSNNRWYLNGGKISNGTYVPVDNGTYTGTYYYIEV